jgi:heme/copper-type cytochrome/quinol oxidase subunit 3
MDLKKAYYYLYYKIYKFDKSISDDSLNEWKPLITIVLLNIFLFFQIFNWYSIITKQNINIKNPALLAFPVAFLLTIMNYMYFLHKNKWKNYIGEFEKYDKSKKRIGGFKVLFIVAIIFGGLIYSYYRLSLIDWKQYK